MKRRPTFADAASLVYFIVAIVPGTFILTPLCTICALGDMAIVISTGAATEFYEPFAIFLLTLCAFPSLLVPCLRPMYARLPWLAAYVVCAVVGYTILVSGVGVMKVVLDAYGGEYFNVAIVVLVLWLAAGRVLQCALCVKYPLRDVGAPGEADADEVEEADDDADQRTEPLSAWGLVLLVIFLATFLLLVALAG